MQDISVQIVEVCTSQAYKHHAATGFCYCSKQDCKGSFLPRRWSISSPFVRLLVELRQQLQYIKGSLKA